MLGIYKLSALSQLVSFTRAMFSPKMLNKQVVITYNFLITLPNTYSSLEIPLRVLQVLSGQKIGVELAALTLLTTMGGTAQYFWVCAYMCTCIPSS